MLLPDLKSIVLNDSDLIGGNYEGMPHTETYSRSLTTNSSSFYLYIFKLGKLFRFEEQFVSYHSSSSESVSDEF